VTALRQHRDECRLWASLRSVSPCVVFLSKWYCGVVYIHDAYSCKNTGPAKSLLVSWTNTRAFQEEGRAYSLSRSLALVARARAQAEFLCRIAVTCISIVCVCLGDCGLPLVLFQVEFGFKLF